MLQNWHGLLSLRLILLCQRQLNGKEKLSIWWCFSKKQPGQNMNQTENTGLLSHSQGPLIMGVFCYLMRNSRCLFNGDFLIFEIHTGSVPVVSEGSSNPILCGRGGGRKFFSRRVALFLSKRDSPLPHCQQRFSSEDVSLGIQHLCAPAPCWWHPVCYTL